MGTLYISRTDTVQVTENVHVGIGWTFVAGLVSTEEWLDVLVGGARRIEIVDSVSVSEESSVVIQTIGRLSWYIPTRTLEGTNGVRGVTSSFLKISVRELEANGGAYLSKNIPTRSLEGVGSQTWGSTLNKRIPVRSLVARGGAELSDGLIPTRSIEATGYAPGGRLSGYIPVRTITADAVVIVYGTLSKVIPIRSLVAVGEGEYIGVLDKVRPPLYGAGEGSQDYGGELDKKLPPRKLESTGYEVNGYMEGYIPVRFMGTGVGGGSSTGEGGYGSDSTDDGDDYILRYSRP